MDNKWAAQRLRDMAKNYDDDQSGLSESTAESMRRGAEAIEAGEWCIAFDELPVRDGWYLAAVNGHHGDTWYFNSICVVEFESAKNKWYLNGVETDKVTHWRELPDPPEVPDAEELCRRLREFVRYVDTMVISDTNKARIKKLAADLELYIRNE